MSVGEVKLYDSNFKKEFERAFGKNAVRKLFEIRDIINKKADLDTDAVEGNIAEIDSDGNPVDSGKSLATYLTDAIAEYVGERYLTENLVPEAGTEEGRRFGSYAIGEEEDNYAFFDSDGSLVLYGTAGIKVISPVAEGDEATKVMVFSSDGTVKYRTLEEIITDLGDRTWVAERFISENLLQEAGTESGHHLGNKKIEGGLTTTGGRDRNETEIDDGDSPYTVLATDHVIFCDTDGGAIEIDLPAGSSGKTIEWYNVGSSGNDLTVDPNGTETIYGGGAGVAATFNDGEGGTGTYSANQGWR